MKGTKENSIRIVETTCNDVVFSDEYGTKSPVADSNDVAAMCCLWRQLQRKKIAERTRRIGSETNRRLISAAAAVKMEKAAALGCGRGISGSSYLMEAAGVSGDGVSG
ncbi:hypothetical protein MRB53_029264 [Persea americana]|uniref:Uncharacterized protein n=1 Tax=Persea americana TaxID=3435 RepID=A0ACC2KHV5_PERAE|nr:hypothetical protein MRB53_029264 [Persea americana]